MRWLRHLSWVVVIPMLFVAAAAVARFVYLERDVRRELGDDVVGPLRVAQIEIDAWREMLLLRANAAAAVLAAERRSLAVSRSDDAFANAARVAAGNDSAIILLASPRGVILRSSGAGETSMPRVIAGEPRELLTARCGDKHCAEVRVQVPGGTETAAILVLRVPITDRTFRRLDTSRLSKASRASLLVRQADSVFVVASAGRDTSHLPTRSFAWDRLPPHVRKAFTSGQTTGTADRGLVHDRVIYATAGYPDMGVVLLRELHGDEMIERMLGSIVTEILLLAGLFLFALGYGISQRRVTAMRRQQELAAVRSDFVAGVSHELRTPLAQIRLFAELLRSGSLRGPDENQRALTVIEKESGRLAILVDNILSHASSGRKGGGRDVTDNARGTDVARDVAYVVEAFAPLAAEKKVRVLASGVDSVVAPVDSHDLRQILLNFLENAVKYGPREQTVTIGTVETVASISVSVCDEGPGVTDAERDTIWQAFERGSAAEASRAGGSGIGLSVVRDLAARYGGRVRAERAPTGGTCFTVEFPRKPAG